MIPLKKILTNKPILKINACILGSCFWYFLSQLRPLELNRIVPVTFYNQHAETIEAPETVALCLKGYKKDFYNLNLKDLALHINTESLKKGKNYCYITREDLFLPPGIKVVHCNPLHIVAMIK